MPRGISIICLSLYYMSLYYAGQRCRSSERQGVADHREIMIDRGIFGKPAVLRRRLLSMRALRGICFRGESR